jgi:hypothetical protein
MLCLAADVLERTMGDTHRVTALSLAFPIEQTFCTAVSVPQIITQIALLTTSIVLTPQIEQPFQVQICKKTDSYVPLRYARVYEVR